jgi:HSPB1-associated protein 1
MVDCTIADFAQWLGLTPTTDPEHGSSPLSAFSRASTVAYADYQRFFAVFASDDGGPSFPWTESLGISADLAVPEDANLWWGTRLARTPCHQDTYGCNIVVQLYGRKHWLLFNPDKSPSHGEAMTSTEAVLMPTRIPYEESSVLAGRDVRSGVCSDVDVTLEPGDVLLVPRHWWHDVLSLDDGALSINLWLPAPEDDDARLGEALVHTVLASLLGISDSDSVGDRRVPAELVAPKEQPPTLESGLAHLRTVLDCSAADVSDLDLKVRVANAFTHPATIRCATRMLKHIMACPPTMRTETLPPPKRARRNSNAAS